MGFTLKSLIEKQFSIADLRDAGFSAIEIKAEKKCEDAELLNAGFQQEDIEEKIMQQKEEEPHEDTGSKRQKKMKKKGARNPSRPKRRGSGVSTTSTESS